MYFHNGNSIKTKTFHNSKCNQEFVYVSNLSGDNYLYNENPYLLVLSDGIILGMDQRISSLDLFNKHHTHLETISFNFITTCDSKTLNVSDEKSIQPTQPTWIIFVTLVVALFVFIIIFKKRGNQYEN